LRNLAKECEFGTLEENIIHVQLVLRIQDGHLQKKLLRVPDQTLDKSIEHYKAAEIVKLQQQIVHNETKHYVQQVTSKKKWSSRTDQNWRGNF